MIRKVVFSAVASLLVSAASLAAELAYCKASATGDSALCSTIGVADYVERPSVASMATDGWLLKDVVYVAGEPDDKRRYYFYFEKHD